MSVGDRMKGNYEARQKHMLIRRMPLIVRVDGKSFHTLARGLNKPFDNRFINAIVSACQSTASTMQGFKLAYVQSDEASFLLTDYDTLNTEAHFGYVKAKVESITAATMTAYFNSLVQDFMPISVFDARSFNIPREEVANYFVWRAKDWERNSLSMYCRSFFSHKELHGKGKEQQHELLHSINKNWATDLCGQLKNGTFIRQDGTCLCDVGSSYAEINPIVNPLVNVDEEN